MGFTFRHLQPADPYFAAWQEKRRRTRRAWMAFVAFPIASLALSALCFAIWKSDGFPWVLLPGGIVLLALWPISAVPCPRCVPLLCKLVYLSAVCQFSFTAAYSNMPQTVLEPEVSTCSQRRNLIGMFMVSF